MSETGLVKVDFTPAAITCDFAAMGRKLDEELEPYEGMTAETALTLDVKQAKAHRAYLNSLKKELEAARKAVKKAYDAPLREFEEKVRELVTRIDGFQRMLGDAIDAKTAAEREEKRGKLEQEYTDFAPFFAEGEHGALLPFDRILKSRWLNKSFAYAKAVKEMQEEVGGIAGDYEALKSQAESLEYYGEDVAVFFRTLSLQEALKHDAQRAEEDARLRALQEKQREVQPQPEPVRGTPASQPETTPAAVSRQEAPATPQPTTSRYVLGFSAEPRMFDLIAQFVKSHAEATWYAEGESAEAVHRMARKAMEERKRQ